MRIFLYLAAFLTLQMLCFLACAMPYPLEENQCDDKASCLGRIKEYEAQKQTDNKRALEHLYEMACELKDGESCLKLATLLGETKDKNFPKFFKLALKSCELDYAGGCYLVGKMYIGLQVGLKEDKELPQSKKKKIFRELGINEKDIDNGEKLLYKACELGGDEQDELCVRAGIAYIETFGEKGFKKAFEFWIKGCNLGGAASCMHLAGFYIDGVIVKQDTQKALTLFTKACDKGAGASCLRLGALYAKGKVVEKDLQKAHKLYNKACELKDESGCIALASLYEFGKGVKQDLQKARALYAKACDMRSVTACYHLGAAHYNSKLGLEKDDFQAEALLSKACYVGRLGVDEFTYMENACFMLAHIYSFSESFPRDYAKAKELYTRVCNTSYGDTAAACNNLGIMYEYGKGMIANHTKAAEFYARACDLGGLLSCYNLGSQYHKGQGVKQDFIKARELYTKACNANQNNACYNLGILYYNGEGVRQDYHKAREFYSKACDLGNAGACNNLGVLYSSGQGVRQDSIKAKEFFGKACDLGEQTGCDNYKASNQSQ